VELTGLVITKLDGTAKGGIAVTIKEKLGIPIKFVGLGESLEDFEVFSAESFVKSLFEEA
jgi:fused signal recognition particle receptor